MISKFKKLSIVSAGALTISGILYWNLKDEIFIDYSSIFNKNSHLSKWESKWDHNWDKRDPKSISKPSSTKDKDPEKSDSINIRAVNHIILIRHGQYNTQGSHDGERKLTDLGKLQADVTGMRLAELAIPYSLIVRSTMTRAQETSQLIETHLPNIPVIDDCILVEGAPIPPEPSIGHWKPEKAFFQDGPRIEAAFRKYVHRADPSEKKDVFTVLVCHANVIRYFVCRALQLPPQAWLRISLNHGSITWISVTPSGRVILRCLGETGHMMPQWVTSR